ncbi:MAG: 3'-5' exonuclease [Spirochaetales bacterium]|nr:3'-5' exonuclease [Spirochaetales bacterium]
MQFVAIDFETANNSADSACSIGLVKMDEEGAVIDSFYSLVRPPVLFFDPVCTAVHKLDSIDIAKAPAFNELWPQISEFIGDLPLVAHNAPFDMRVLKGTLESWGILPPINEYYCTLSLSRKLWKGKMSYKLSYLCSEFGWEYDAHNALADAEMCGRIFVKLCGQYLFSSETMDKLFKRLYKKGSNVFPKRLREPDGMLF